MSKQLQIFNSPKFGQVRAVEVDGKPYVVGNDIASMLEYARPYEAVSAHCKGAVTHRVLTEGGCQETKVIPEGDIYRLIVKAADQSRNPDIRAKAEEVEHWIFDEVLPSIRKHGLYAADDLLNDPDLAIKAFTALKEERERNSVLKAQNTVLDAENKLLSKQNLIWADRKVIEALVKKYGAKVGYDQAWREYKMELLYNHSINLNSRITIWRNETGRKTGPKTLSMIHDDEISDCISTAVALCKAHDIETADIIEKYRN